MHNYTIPIDDSTYSMVIYALKSKKASTEKQEAKKQMNDPDYWANVLEIDEYPRTLNFND